MRLLIAMTDRALSLKGEGIRFLFTVRSTLGGYWSDIFSFCAERCVSIANTSFSCFAIGTSGTGSLNTHTSFLCNDRCIADIIVVLSVTSVSSLMQLERFRILLTI
jgi:hypothetical protein